MRRASLAWTIVFATAWVTPEVALAQTADPASARLEATVVAVEKDDMVVDLGSNRGAASGDVVEIWRPLRIRHPVTGKTLTDRFLIGRLQLAQVRPTLSLAKPEGALSRMPEPGDIVILARTATAGALPSPVPTQPSPAAPTTGGEDEAKQLSELFDSLHGTDVPTRVRAYENFVYAHPHGRYALVLWDEARALRRLLSTGETRLLPEPPKEELLSAELQSIDRVVAHEPLRLAVAVHGEVVGVVLHARKDGAPTYVSRSMTPIGKEYWAATIPAAMIEAPGLDYFVEAVGPHGARPVIGNAESPNRAEVLEVTSPPPSHVLGQAAIWTDYASFNAKQANDYVWQTEGFMGARLGDVGIRAVRTGFGVYRGVGGTLQDLDTLHLAPRSVGLTYGYLEGEFGFSPYLSLGVRAVIGLLNDGVNGGALAFFRIGSDLGTNLWFGGEVLGGIGVRGITEFDWNSFRRWPIVLRTEVTNEPAGVASSTSPTGESAGAGDVGVRAIAQVGYRVLPQLVVSVRGSYQGRTIDHSGPGAGAAVGYTW